MSPLYPDNSPVCAKGSPLTTPRQHRTLGRRRPFPTSTTPTGPQPQHDAIQSRHSDNHSVLPPLPFGLSDSNQIMTTPRPTTHDDTNTPNQLHFSPHRTSSILDIIDQALMILQDDDAMDTTDYDENQYRPRQQ